MMQSERTIINCLLIASGLFLGPYLVTTTLEENPTPLLLFGGFAFLCFVFFIIKDSICVFPLFGAFVFGRLTFLPYGLMPQEIFNMIVILYYAVTYVALKQKTIRGGPLYFLLPIMVIALIVIYHNREIGLHALGSSVQGSRVGILVLLGIIAYIAGINIPTPSVPFLARVPWYCFFITAIAAAPFIATTYFPSLAPVMYHITDEVNVEAYADSQSAVGSDDEGAASRAGFNSFVGMALQVFLLSYFPINTWWRPDRWPVIFLSMFSLYLVLTGGYRSNFMLFGFVTLLATACYSTWRIVVFLPLFVVVGLFLSMIHEDHPWNMDLPIPIQRSLSFLPGKWDPEVLDSAKGSNEFRENIIRVYKQEYLYKSPWIGNGFLEDVADVEGYGKLSEKDTYDKYYQAKSFIASKSFHTGWVSLYDAVGLIGGAAFVALGVSTLLASGRFVFGPNINRREPLFPLKVWLFCNIAREFFGYFTVFGFFGGSMTSLCAYVTILVHLLKIERKEGGPISPPTIYPEPLVQVESVQPFR